MIPIGTNTAKYDLSIPCPKRYKDTQYEKCTYKIRPDIMIVAWRSAVFALEVNLWNSSHGESMQGGDPPGYGT